MVMMGMFQKRKIGTYPKTAGQGRAPLAKNLGGHKKTWTTDMNSAIEELLFVG